MKDAGRVSRDDRSALRLELERFRGLGELHGLLRLEGLLAELDVLESELVDPRLQGVVVGPEVLDLGDGLPEAARLGADLPEDLLGRYEELRYKGRAGPHEGRVTEEEQGEGAGGVGGDQAEAVGRQGHRTGMEAFVFADARRLGYKPATLAYTRLFKTANGTVRGAPVTIPEVAIGPIHLKNVEASVNEHETEGSLLGMSFLGRLSGYQVSGDTLTLRQ